MPRLLHSLSIALLIAGACACDDTDELAASTVDMFVDRDRGPLPDPDSGPAPDTGEADLGEPDATGPDAAEPDGAAPDAALPEPAIPFEPACENLADGHCALPWPTDRWLMADEGRATGFRLVYDSDALPPNVAGQPIDPAPFERLDGFSPSSQLLSVWPSPPDLTDLDGPDEPERSLAPDFPTVVLDLETGERLPHWIELDARAQGPAETLVYIRPMTRLMPNRRYGVAIRGLQDADGAAFEAPAGFAALRDGTPSNVPAFEARRPGYETLFTALTDAGIARDTLQLAWHFHTASFASTNGDLLAMRDDAVERLGPRGLGCTIETVEEDVDENVLRRIEGTITTPWYLNRATQPAEIVRDADGTPQWVEDREVQFTAIVPRIAAEGPQRLVILGHGLFGEARGTLNNGIIKRAAQDVGAVFAGIDWTGMSSGDLGFLATALTDVSRFWHIGEMLRQTHISFIALTRSMRGVCLDDPAFRVDDRPVADPDRTSFLGVSQGSILGGAQMAVNPDIERGVLAVGGSAFSFMIERSIHYLRFELLLDPNYPRRIDSGILMALSQHIWDRAESSSWLRWMGSDEAGAGDKRILYLIAENDAQVPNLSSHRAARLAGWPVLDQSTHSPWGVEVVASPYDGSAYLAMDAGDRPTPPGNISPPEDDGGHGFVPAAPAALETVQTFIDTGVIDVACEGPCVVREL